MKRLKTTEHTEYEYSSAFTQSSSSNDWLAANDELITSQTSNQTSSQTTSQTTAPSSGNHPAQSCPAETIATTKLRIAQCRATYEQAVQAKRMAQQLRQEAEQMRKHMVIKSRF